MVEINSRIHQTKKSVCSKTDLLKTYMWGMRKNGENLEFLNSVKVFMIIMVEKGSRIPKDRALI